MEDVVALSQIGMTLRCGFCPKRKLCRSPSEASVDSDFAKFGKTLQKGSRRRSLRAARWQTGQEQLGFVLYRPR